MSELVDQSVRICTKRLEYQMRMKLELFNVYDKFIENYRIILKSESDNDLSDIYKKAIDTCDLLSSYINRGLLAFYRGYHEYSTVFISDYIDWRRPRMSFLNQSTIPLFGLISEKESSKRELAANLKEVIYSTLPLDEKAISVVPPPISTLTRFVAVAYLRK